MVVELLWRKRATAGGRSTEPELPDKGKQTKCVHAPDGVRPPKSWAKELFADEKVEVKVRGGSDVPGVTSQAAGTETVGVVGEMHDDRLNDLLGEFGGGRRA